MAKQERIRMALFLLIALVLVAALAVIFDRKTACYYTLGVNGYFHEEPESVDVIGYGSSRMYCTLDPLVLHHETGLRAYVLSTQQQPLAATEYYMRESLKTQSPRVLLLEATMAFHTKAEAGEAPLRDCLDPLPWSENKRGIIRTLVPAGERDSYYFNFLKYHQRWKELSRRDFDLSWLDERDPFRGYIFLTPERGADCRRQSYDGVEAELLPEENLALLRSMAALARENGAELVLMASPYEVVVDDLGYLKSLHHFCEEEGIAFWDLNLAYDELGIDEARDFFDTGHFNVRGSCKATRYLGRKLAALLDARQTVTDLDREIEQNYEQLILPCIADLA